MTDVQQRAIAAGFLHALQTTPALYQEWNATSKDDAVAIGALIQKTMGLTSAPGKDDLAAMATYIDKNLADQMSALQKGNPQTPSHVGIIFLTQQS